MAGPPVRESYNAKARGSTAGSRKKGKPKKKSKSEQQETQSDPNADIITPKTQEIKEMERKDKLLQELASQSESKWTSKKKKRLEKYIDKKLKKEERLVIFDKLAKTQASMSSAILQSSSTLGTGKLSTFEERQEKAEDALVKKSLSGQAGKRKRHQDIYAVEDIDDVSFDENDEEEVRPKKLTKLAALEEPQTSHEDQIMIVEAPPNPPPKKEGPIAVGSALQRNADGSVVAPKVRPRTKGKLNFQRGWRKQATMDVQPESDSSFDSSDSENDSEHDESDEDNECSSSSLEDEDDQETSGDEKEPKVVTKKSIGFKNWAIQQLNAAKGYEPPATSSASDVKQDPVIQTSPLRKKKASGPPPEMRGPLGEDLKLPSTSFAQQLFGPKSTTSAYVKSVEIKRPPEVEEARILLPIVTEEQPIMEAILLNPVVIICGETGSGKTTQVPQFLYEAGFGTPGSENPGMIGITQPRRVAAMSMAARVGHELSLTSSRISYQIRYDATVSPNTSIKFMTDGVLLRELATDFLLTKYSVIIVDEAHERSINTDIILGVLSRVIRLRENLWKEKKDNVKPLRLVIMSATLRVSDFAENTNLFPTPPPVINVAARQHPVTVHFSRRTYPDYVTQAIKKTTKIHTRLPLGGILIFLTGQAEITGVCRKLEAKFGQKAISAKKNRRSRIQPRSGPDNTEEDGFYSAKQAVAATQADVEVEDIDLGNAVEDDLALDVDENIEEEDDPEGLESDDDDKLDEELGLEEDTDVPMHIVPLYSLLPSEKQMRVFETPPAGSRLVVVSTNVSETSLTIPGIRYVVDCGRAKERHYDVTNGIQSFQVSWVSKASAAQRAGRAGRTGPGHCYRLYSSALFEHYFDNFSTPEIQRMPIEGVVLQMKSLHIDTVINFPFPTPPDRFALQKAEKALSYLGALTPAKKALSDKEGQITDLGRSMALFPLSPRFSRMLVSGRQHGCLPYIICLVSALSVGDPFVHEESLGLGEAADADDNTSTGSNLNSESVRAKLARQDLRKAFYKSQHVHSSLGNYSSDLFKVLSVVGAYEYAGGGQQFCTDYFVRPKAMEEIHKLRAQINAITQANFPGTDSGFVPGLPPPTEHQLKVLKQILAAGFIDQVAVRKDLVDKHQASGTQYATSKGIAYQALGIQEDVFIHPSSLLIGGPPPDYVVYHEVIRTSRVYLKGLTVINPAWLSSLGKDILCTFSKPVPNNAGTLMTIPRFGPQGWELPAIKAAVVKQS